MKKRKAWNSGLTKETDKRVKKISDTMIELYKTNSNLGMQGKKQSEEMKTKLRKNKDRAEKIRKTQKQRFREGELYIPDNKGKKLPEEAIKKMRGPKTKEHCKNIKKGLKKAFKEGKIKVWCEGKTADDDVRIQRRNTKSKQTHLILRRDLNSIYNTEEFRKRISAGKQGINLDEWKSFINSDAYKNFTDKFKRAIRKRDNYICLKCGKHQEKEKHSLSVHHINYDKDLTIKENCCTVCRKCNSEVNANKKHWIKFFQSLLAGKYGYKYSEDNKVILNLKSKNDN